MRAIVYWNWARGIAPHWTLGGQLLRNGREWPDGNSARWLFTVGGFGVVSLLHVIPTNPQFRIRRSLAFGFFCHRKTRAASK